MTPPSFIIETTRKKYVVPDNNGDIVWICVEYVKLDSRGVRVPNAKVGPYSRRAVEGWSMTNTIRRLVSVIVVASAESTRGPPVGAVVVPASAIATRSERRRMYREPIWLDVKLRSEQSGEKMRNRNRKLSKKSRPRKARGCRFRSIKRHARCSAHAPIFS